jgi:hypothetical protein
MAMAMAGQGGHGWARFRTRLSLSFDFSRVIFARAKKVIKGEWEPGNEAIAFVHNYEWTLGLKL